MPKKWSLLCRESFLSLSRHMQVCGNGPRTEVCVEPALFGHELDRIQGLEDVFHEEEQVFFWRNGPVRVHEAGSSASGSSRLWLLDCAEILLQLICADMWGFFDKLVWILQSAEFAFVVFGRGWSNQNIIIHYNQYKATENGCEHVTCKNLYMGINVEDLLGQYYKRKMYWKDY